MERHDIPLVVVDKVPMILGSLTEDLAEFCDHLRDEFLKERSLASTNQTANKQPQAQLTYTEADLQAFYEYLVDEFLKEKKGEILAASSSQSHQHNLLHLPADPACEICQQGKLTRTPARRKHDGKKEMAETFGQRIHCDLIGPTAPSLHDEVYALITRDEATGCPAARPLKNKTAEAVAEAFWDIYATSDPPVRAVRTDNGLEFSGEFERLLKEKVIRHERSLPFRPQTNSRAERFHRTMAESIRCMMLASGVPYAFWAFCLMAFMYLYARAGNPSPLELKHGKQYVINDMPLFGTACFYLADKNRSLKFEPTGRRGVIIGYGQLHSYYVLDFQHYVDTAGEARIVQTRDVRFPKQEEFPFQNLKSQSDDFSLWLNRLFDEPVEGGTIHADAQGRCQLCEGWAVTSEPTCRACLYGGRRVHDRGIGCLRARCQGHASLDIPPPPNDAPRPPPPGDQGDGPEPPGDDSMDDDNDEDNDEDDDGNNGGGDGQPRRRWRDLRRRRTQEDDDVNQPSDTTMPERKRWRVLRRRPETDGDIRGNTSVPPHPDLPRIVLPIAETRNRSDDGSPTDAPPRARQRLQIEVGDGMDVDGNPSGASASSSAWSLTMACRNQHYFGLVTKNIEPNDWRFHCPAAQKAAREELASMTEHGVWDMNCTREWDDVRRSDPNAEVLGAKLLIGIKDHEFLDEAELGDATWKARFVCTGNHIVDTEGRKVRHEDLLYAAPVDLHNARIVVMHGAMRGKIVQGDVKCAYLQAPLGGHATWLRFPKGMRHLLPEWAQQLRDPVVRLLRALYGHPRSGGDWSDYFAKRLREKGWKEFENEKSLWLSPCSSCMLAIYVDDLVISGPDFQVDQHMRDITKMVTMGRVHAIARFLGTHYNIQRSKNHVDVTITQPEYSELLIKRYKKARGISGPLRYVDTPIVHDDLESAFGDTDGEGSEYALMHLGGLLFLMRSSRPDLAFSVNFVARYAANWSVASSKRLHRISEYLETTKSYGICWRCPTLDSGVANMTLQVFVDADHAGCLDTSRSTSGWNVFVVSPDGKHYSLLDWASRRQAATARSTAEAEVIAAADCMQAALPIQAVCEDGFGHAISMIVYTDSDNARSAFVNGYSRRLRYLRKYQRICLGFAHDSLEASGGKVERVDTGENNSDLHTKPLARTLFGKHRAAMGVRDCSEALAACSSRGRSVVRLLSLMLHSLKLEP